MNQPLRVSLYVALTVLGWAIMAVLIAHWWAVRVAPSEPLGSLAFLGAEALRIAPTLAYFLATGFVLGRMLGPLRWPALAATIAMAIAFAWQRMTFLVDFDLLIVCILAVNYLLPIAAALVGASVARIFANKPDNPVAT